MLQISGISKSFGMVKANDDVSLDLGTSEIVGLLGENGAGKSTLLSIVSGYLKPDAGHVKLDGRSLAFGSPRNAIALGIGLVHQHLSVIPEFTVRAQLALAGYTDRQLPSLIASLDPDQLIGDLSLGQRQRLEIARALVSKPRVLLLDEPTTILTPSEAEELFTALRDLRNGGTTIVLVTHKLREVLSVADRMVVMAGGKLTAEFGRDTSGGWPPGTEQAVLQSMFGALELAAVPRTLVSVERDAEVTGTNLLRLVGLGSSDQTAVSRVEPTTIGFQAGRIYTVAGIDGQGQRELAHLIAGYQGQLGSVFLGDDDITGDDAFARSLSGIRLLLDDRKGEAAIPSFTLTENLAVKRSLRRGMTGLGMMRWRSIAATTSRLIAAWDVRPAHTEARFGTLSGGNMQRFLVARELMFAPRVLLALNPVQGLDARTAALLWDQFREICAGGGVVIAFLSDLDTAMEQGDLVGVMRRGELSPFVSRSEAERATLATMMVNGW